MEKKIKKECCIPQTLPGEVVHMLFDYAKDYKKNIEYNIDEIFDNSGGVLLDVISRSKNTIKVLYMSYDHHNEPRITSLLSFKNNNWEITEQTFDYSRTKYKKKMII